MATFIDNAKVMTKGQITLPKDIREVLGVKAGDRVAFVVDGQNVRIVNAALYAMEMLRREMAGQDEAAGLDTEEKIVKCVKETRRDRGLGA